MTEFEPFITEPGIYDIPVEQYHHDPVVGGSLSNSGAKKLMPPSCPALFKEWRDGGTEHKDAFDFGRATHARVLGAGEPVVVVDADDWRSAKARAQRDEARAAGATAILAKDDAVIDEMAAKLRAHPIASALLDPDTGKPEQTIVWRDPETGVWCRALVDFLREPAPGQRYLLPDYKGLALDTVIPTPEGATTMGQLSVGDQVFAADGSRCTVTAKSEVHWRTCYRIRFDDGSTVICDDEHRWLTTSGRENRVTAVRTTEEIRDSLHLYGQAHHRIALAGPLQLDDVDLPADPYVLGCWLGDGSVGAGRISKPDGELFDHIAARGYEVAPVPAGPKCPTRTIYGLQPQLRAAGVLDHKAIPDSYLRAGYSQRLDLLRGLMDTDGSWNRTRKRAVFTTVEKALAEQVRDLACSLGQRAVVSSYTAKGYGKTLTAYRVVFRPVDLMPFQLSRKADLITTTAATRTRQRLIVAVEPMPTVPTQCITVDSPDSTYLCTESMIPTHNTAAKVDPDSIQKALWEYGYYGQGGWYSEAVQHAGLSPDGPPAFLLIFQMKTAPYLVVVAQVEPDSIGWGHARNRYARDLYRRCVATDTWPGYADDQVISVRLPVYAEYQLEGAYRRGEFDPEGATA